MFLVLPRRSEKIERVRVPSYSLCLLSNTGNVL